MVPDDDGRLLAPLASGSFARAIRLVRAAGKR